MLLSLSGVLIPGLLSPIVNTCFTLACSKRSDSGERWNRLALPWPRVTNHSLPPKWRWFVHNIISPRLPPLKKIAADKRVFAKLPLVTLFISILTRLRAVVCMEVRFEVKVTRGFSVCPRRFRDSLSPLRGLLLISFAKKNQEKPLGPGYCTGKNWAWWITEKWVKENSCTRTVNNKYVFVVLTWTWPDLECGGIDRRSKRSCSNAVLRVNLTR